MLCLSSASFYDQKSHLFGLSVILAMPIPAWHDLSSSTKESIFK